MVSRSRGFTLLELMVAGAVSLIIAASAGMVLSRLVLVHRRDVERARLRASAQLALARLASDLRHAGLGLPAGPRASSPDDPFPPRVFLATSQRIGFVADLPRPDALVNGFSLLSSDQPPAPTTTLGLINELSGDCAAVTGGLRGCDTETESLLLAPTGAGGCGASPTAPTCPWALRKYRPGEQVVVANGFGQWEERQVAARLHEVSLEVRGLALTRAVGHLSPSVPNRGFVSTPDRIFYQLNGTTLERGQCWGSVGSPATASEACITGPDGTGWEPLATHVTLFTLDYSKLSGAALGPLPLSQAAAASTGRVRAAIALESTVAGAPVRASAETLVALRR